MTAKELIRIAKNINPDKLASDPQSALEDAYLVWEAVRLVEMEKVSAPSHLELPEPREVSGTLYLPKPKRKKKKDPEMSTVDHLRIRINRGGDNGNDVAKKIGVSSATVYAWLAGRFKPSADNIAKIEGYLTDVGYYE